MAASLKFKRVPKGKLRRVWLYNHDANYKRWYDDYQRNWRENGNVGITFQEDEEFLSARQRYGYHKYSSWTQKRRAVQSVLLTHPEWSDRKVAMSIGVSHRFVSKVRNGTAVTLSERRMSDFKRINKAMRGQLRKLKGAQHA